MTRIRGPRASQDVIRSGTMFQHLSKKVGEWQDIQRLVAQVLPARLSEQVRVGHYQSPELCLLVPAAEWAALLRGHQYALEQAMEDAGHACQVSIRISMV